MSVDKRRRSTEEQFASLAPLFDPVRRALYLYVARQPHDVGRDEASAAVGVARRLAAFHLDKLVDAGFLEASFRRLGTRSGPGAGRPSKLYKPVAQERQLSLPPRDYELLADLLAVALQAQDGTTRASLGDIARRHGRRVGADVLAGAARHGSRTHHAAGLSEALAALGYQPYRDGPDLRLRNCPFHSLAERHRELICGMNLCLVQGVLEGVGDEDLSARLEVRSPDCCVVIGTAGEP